MARRAHIDHDDLDANADEPVPRRRRKRGDEHRPHGGRSKGRADKRPRSLVLHHIEIHHLSGGGDVEGADETEAVEPRQGSVRGSSARAILPLVLDHVAHSVKGYFRRLRCDPENPDRPKGCD